MNVKEILYINKVLEEKLKDKWLFSNELMSKITKSGSIQNIKSIPINIKKIFKCSLDIDSSWHLKM